MSSEWQTVKLKDIADLKGGYAFKSGEYTEEGVFVLRTLNIEADGSITKDGAKYVSRDSAEQYDRFSLTEWDTLFVMVGATLGKTGLVRKCDLPALLNQNMWVIRSTSEQVNPRYLHYAFREESKSLLGFASGAARDFVRRDDFRNLELRLPPRDTQDRISRFVGAIDDKIQINHQINQTLEQMAQAIFKSWFVDFEPVKAKIAALEAGGSEEDALLAAMQAISGKSANELARLQTENPEQYDELRSTAELFPSALQESELGEIPEGWAATDFGDVSQCFDKHRIPLSKREREKRQGSIPYYGATSVMDYVDEPIFDGVYLLLGEDGSVIKEDGSPFTQYIWGKSWVNNHAHVLQGSNGVSTEQLYLFIGMQNISAYVTGAVQLKLNQKNMNSIPFIKAPNELNTEFSKLVEPFFGLLRNLTDENIALAETRNLLLPKLLSGELSVVEAEEQVAEVLEA